MSDQFINYNGNIISSTNPILGLQNRAFKYGDGLFETIRVVNRKVMFADLHAKRLMQGMKLLKLENSNQFNSDFINQKISELLISNSIYKDARVRLSVFRNDGGFYSPESNDSLYALEVSNINYSGYQLNKKGLLITTYKGMQKPLSAYSGVKSSNALLYVLAGIEAKESGFDDLLILNSTGNIAETISSNIFIVKNEKIYTPALSEGGIDGVMRKAIISLAKKEKISLTETIISVENLLLADEIFLTNAIQGVQWVMGYGAKRYFNKTSKLLTDYLNNHSLNG